MARYFLTQKAKQDFQEIWQYIASDNLKAANNLEKKFYDSFELLAQNPYIGQKREYITTKPVRFFGIYDYQIIYNPKQSPLIILRILNGYRNMKNLLLIS